MLNHYEYFKSLVSLAENNTDKFMVIFINGDSETTEAESGFLEIKETLEIEEGLSQTSTYYRYYSNPSKFVGDIVLNKLPISQERYLLLYSVAQIGIDVNRRSFIPNFAQLHNIFNLTSDSYHLALMQNKYHYYELVKGKINVPQTYLYTGNTRDVFEYIMDKKYVLKPNLECSARGVEFIDNNINLKEKVIELHNEFKQAILIQEFIEGTEVEVPVLVIGGIPYALPPVKIIKENSGLTWDDILHEKYGFELLSTYNLGEIQKSAEIAIGILEGSGLCRVDFIIDEQGEPWLFDIAAIPLISKHSSCFTSFNYLFPDDEYALYKALVGAKLFELV